MTIEDALFSRLSTYAGLTALISTRVYAVQAPQNATLPHIIYSRISSTKESLLSSDTDISLPRFQIDCYGSTYASVRAVYEQVRQALQRWAGVEATVNVLDSFVENDQDEYDENSKEYRVIADFTIWHRE